MYIKEKWRRKNEQYIYSYLYLSRFDDFISSLHAGGGSVKLKVVDNFLDKEDFMKLQHHMLVEKFFPWYFQDTKDFEADEDLNQYQFTHTFYKNYQPVVAPFLQFSNYFS